LSSRISSATTVHSFNTSAPQGAATALTQTAAKTSLTIYDFLVDLNRQRSFPVSVERIQKIPEFRLPFEMDLDDSPKTISDDLRAKINRFCG